jgi:hypothetical protein
MHTITEVAGRWHVAFAVDAEVPVSKTILSCGPSSVSLWDGYTTWGNIGAGVAGCEYGPSHRSPSYDQEAQAEDGSADRWGGKGS